MAVNIVGDHALRPEWRRLMPEKQPLFLSTNPLKGNVYLAPGRLEEQLAVPLEPISLDLCEIAAYVYLADKMIPRGSHEKWVRDLSFLIPVRVPEKWQKVRTLLTNTVGVLSGDNVQFRFVKRHGPEHPRRASSARSSTGPSDCVALFSGGLDSLAGTVHLAGQGRRPLLASHYVSSLGALQQELVRTLGRHLGQTFEHFQYRVTSRRAAKTVHPLKARESTHRSRSFLFMSFAAVAAAARGLSEIFICENGVLALNVPISDARKGTRSTRHAHPLYLTYFNELIDALYERPFEVRNPFFYWTKREEAELLATAGLHAILRTTVSCWGYPNSTLKYRYSNHCGTCIPCLVRRVATIAAGLESYDDRYAVDVFGTGAVSGDRYRNIQDLVYFAETFATSSKTELLYRYPELVMVEQGAKVPGDRLEAIVGVYRRFAKDVLDIATARAPQLLSKDRQVA